MDIEKIIMKRMAEEIPEYQGKRLGKRGREALGILSYYKAKYGFYPEFGFDVSSDYWYPDRKNRSKGKQYYLIGATGPIYTYYIWMWVDKSRKLKGGD